MQLTLTPLADAGVTVLPPDIVWNGTVGDFAIATTQAQGGPGGLVAANPLQTAVLLLLFSDVRAEAYEINEAHGGDRRGWAGDGFDVDTAAGEAPLGSKLWLYRRAVLGDQTALQVAAEAKRALQPLIRQGAAVRIDTTATPDFDNDRLGLVVAIYGRDGANVYNAQFDLLWRRADGGL